MSEVALFLSSIEAERVFEVSRFVVQRAALRGEIRFRILPGGRTEYFAEDVKRFGAERTIRRAAGAPVERSMIARERRKTGGQS